MVDYYNEPYRPQFHISPEEKWMNDPNGLVFHQGVYHLFDQYYPDEHGLIFSGSAVVDKNNSSGFGTKENPPLVAFYAYHLMEGEEAGRSDFQT